MGSIEDMNRTVVLVPKLQLGNPSPRSSSFKDTGYATALRTLTERESRARERDGMRYQASVARMEPLCGAIRDRYGLKHNGYPMCCSWVWFRVWVYRGLETRITLRFIRATYGFTQLA